MHSGEAQIAPAVVAQQSLIGVLALGLASRKVVWSSLTLALWLVLAAGALSPVGAYYEQDGRESSTHNVDGSYARLQGHSFNPDSGQCVLYSTLSYDSTAYRQLESGIVTCKNADIDATCTSGHVFVERFDGSQYFCTPGYTFLTKYQYDATTYRASATSTTFNGQINGANLSQSGFGLSDYITPYAWGEATGGNFCPVSQDGSFIYWEKYDTSAGWAYITSSTIDHSGYGLAGSPCWSRISSTDSTGGFNVDP